MGFALGVAASVVAGLLLAAGSRYGLPAAWSWLNRDGNVAGVWRTFDSCEPEAAPCGEATIRQVRRRVRMEVVRHTKRDGTGMTSPRTFTYEGTFRNGNLAA